MAAAGSAAAPLRRLFLRLRDPPPLPFNTLLSRLAPHLQQGPTLAPAPAPALALPTSTPAQTPSGILRDALFSFHPGLQAHPCLDPIGGARDEAGPGAAEVWADSVKKKRKRKMNKHKLRKLRKRLRRQT
ncbi:uncharacterized protein LOC100276344 [Zea mays]|jgi:hypothetical protein|uniref:Small ribosomal subunit protein mS38 n=1 Tax=Zea mays TaxID=4577 RepID=B6T968_MAIZE|nr:uncharacterized protein LOC100276344 [Zea mays]ACG33651.1 hypothetical protein [Zea mays]ACN29002.1 unknown [Zea mays]ONM53484.1 hypothetical protein ZEAMMB73_Zm00001d019645 [Zea mays]|eukprot:NP_001143626.1 uncharacterized protein LOC100276344 [Zea mays]